MNLLGLLCAYLGLCALAFAMPRHHQRLLSREPSPRRSLALRLLGWLLVSLALPLTGAAQGPELAPVQWLAGLGVAGFVLSLLLAYAPRLWALPLSLLPMAIFW